MNLIPTCEYESDDDEDDGEIIQIEEITTENEVENLFKAFEDASTHMNDILDERVSQFIASVDDSFRSSTGGASVRNNPRTSLILTESQHDLIVLNKPKPNLLFGSSFRKPQPLLTSNSKRFYSSCS